MNAVPHLQGLRHDSLEFIKWRRDTEVAIVNTFGNDSRQVQDFLEVEYIPRVTNWSADRDNQLQVAYVRGLGSAASVIASMIDEIGEHWEDVDDSISTRSTKADGQETTNEVFVVHGRDNGAKDTVARLLTKLGLQPVVLNEQPNEGRTIIEKFEYHALRVGFAIVLLTPDDVGSLQDESSESQPRARQNVVFELGYFIGKLGRDRTCALLKGDVEVPSDYYGVLYVEMNESQDWVMKLVLELKRAGFDIDANLMYE